MIWFVAMSTGKRLGLSRNLWLQAVGVQVSNEDTAELGWEAHGNQTW